VYRLDNEAEDPASWITKPQKGRERCDAGSVYLIFDRFQRDERRLRELIERIARN